MSEENLDTQTGGLPNEAEAGNAGAQSPQETPEVAELKKHNAQLTKKINELAQTVETIALREEELKRSAVVEEPAEFSDSEVKAMFEMPADEATKRFQELTKKQAENLKRKMAAMQEETANIVMSKTKFETKLEGIRTSICSTKPHLADHVDTIMREAGSIFQSERGMTPEQAVERVVSKYQASFDKYAKKTEQPRAKEPVPQGAVSETSGQKIVTQPPVQKTHPKNDVDWHEQERRARSVKNNLIVMR